MFYKYWQDYIGFLDNLMHIPLEGLEKLQEGSFELSKMLKDQTNALNKALLECYKAKEGEGLTPIPFINILVFEGGKVLFNSITTERIKELSTETLNSYRGVSAFPIDLGRTIGEYIPKLSSDEQSSPQKRV